MRILACLLLLPVLALAESSQDSFQAYLSLRTSQQKRLPETTRQWMAKLRAGDWAAALESAPKTSAPALKNEISAAKLYVLWQSAFSKTFFDQWLKSFGDSTYASSSAEKALEAFLLSELDNRLLATGVAFDASQRQMIDRLPARAPLSSLKAWLALKGEGSAEKALKALASNSPLRPLLTRAAVLTSVRKNDRANALRILETEKPSIESNHNLDGLATYDVTKARILYNSKQWDTAAQYYLKIPNHSTHYLQAREELAWVYLQQGDSARLRGELAALTSPLFHDRFQPEVYLLRSISDVKLCYLDRLDGDIADFQNDNAGWARRIDEALKSVVPPAPILPDEWTAMSQRWEASLAKEKAAIDRLQSPGSAAFWRQERLALATAMTQARQIRRDNNLRQWRNMQSELREAIRKMQFVKVEYLNQLRLSDGTKIPGNKVADNGDSRSILANDSTDKKNRVFPASTEVWADEWFHLRSAARARCLKKSGGQ